MIEEGIYIRFLMLWVFIETRAWNGYLTTGLRGEREANGVRKAEKEKSGALRP